MSQSNRFFLGARLFFFTLLIGAGLYLLYRMDFDVSRLFASRHEVPGWMFVLAMSLLPVMGFPIAAFYLFAGATYGFIEAWLYCLASLSINMSLSFLVAKYCLHEFLTKLLMKAGYALPKLSEINEFRFTFLLRTVPGPPFPVQNYLLSLLGTRFPVYLSISLLCQGVIAAGMVACGGVLPDTITIGHILVGLALLSVLLVMKSFFSWRKKRTGD